MQREATDHVVEEQLKALFGLGERGGDLLALGDVERCQDRIGRAP
jgi:hypothetical protein